MLRSKYCQLEGQNEQDLTTLGECPLDQASTCSLILVSECRHIHVDYLSNDGYISAEVPLPQVCKLDKGELIQWQY